jgi:outer membrane protein OmpA-like peptidoglycan-associated protein
MAQALQQLALPLRAKEQHPMADVIRRNHLPGDPRYGSDDPRHRADEIHIHHREQKRSWWPYALLALLAVGLLALWGWSRRHRMAEQTAVSPPIERRIEPAVPAPPPPPAPERPVAPVVPVPQAAPPATDTAQPEAVGPDAGAAPSEPESGAAAAGTAACNQTILFDANQTALTDDNQRELKIITECVKGNPGKVTLEGRSDPRGNAEYNKGLANRRAASVKQGLAALGVSSDQVTTRTVETQVCSEATEECWQKNRSVTISVER